jgi:hypothetical protein
VARIESRRVAVMLQGLLKLFGAVKLEATDEFALRLLGIG